MEVSVNRYSLGVHLGHDRGAALVSNGELVAHIAEERLDRIKSSNSPELPLKSIEAVLDIGGIRSNDLGVVGISYTNVQIERIIHVLKDELRDTLGAPTLQVIGVGHHDGHAWSTYCTANVQDALIVVADGSGDIVGDKLEAESVYLGSGDAITLVDRRLQEFGLSRPNRRNAFVLPYMHDLDRRKETSLGHKYEQFTYLAGFGQREAGKTMGLAGYGRPLFHPAVPRIRNLQFSLTCETGLVEIDQVWQASGEPWHRFLKQRAADIAATGQQLIEEYMIGLLNALNPRGDPKVEKFGTSFAVGDKVMQIENDYDKEVYNGDIGYVEAIDLELGEMTIAFDGRPVTYAFGELDQIVLAYATTIHKSQGSEYPAVVIPVTTQHYMMLQRNLLYTGVTRGKRLVILLGQKKAVAIAVKNVSGRRRWSKLREWLTPVSLRLV